jgi:arylsulfatase A-like enzyme
VTLEPLPESAKRPYNVIFIVIDSLRADHVQALGYRRKTTPNLDRLAERGWTFTQAFSQAAATQISFPAFFSAVSPVSMEWQRQGSLQMSARHKTLAELLSDRGYRTAFFFNGWIEEHMQGAMRGFAVREDYWPDRREWQKWRASSSASTLGRGIHFIEQMAREGKGRPFFLTLYFEDPHAPYERYDRSDVPRFGTADKDRYDQEIAFADRHVGVLLDYLRYRPELERNTILVVTADHGEEFREHGGQHHGHNCHVESTHVPLFVLIPGEPARRSDVPVGLVDIAPTLLERIGSPMQESDVDGRSLRWALSATPAEADLRPLFCTLFDDRNVVPTLTHAVRRGGMLLVRRESTGAVQLFDARADPAERVDVAKDPRFATVRTELEQVLRAAQRFAFPR